MNDQPQVPARRQFVTALALASTGLLGACGGGGGEADAAPAAGGTAGGGGGTNPPPSSSNLDAATYAIVVKTDRTAPIPFASAFAIGERLLATNSHVTEGVLDMARSLARQGIRVTGVSAFQSETGREVPLVEAVVHPAYTGAVSPDVGLFVTRDTVASRLTLATPAEAGSVRKGDGIRINGFPGDVWEQVVGSRFQAGLTVPQASLFSGTVQALRNFDTRVVVSQAPERTTDIFEHSADTSGGTSGSPILVGDKVVGVHNAGVYQFVVRPDPRNPGQIIVDRDATGTASFGIHVKHLHNLIAEYNTGVLAADRRFSLPPSSALVGGAGGGQSGTGAGLTFSGSVANSSNPNVTHQLRFTVDAASNIGGTSSWPANPSLSLGARSFALAGKSNADGRFEFIDDTPERIPGFRRGIYVGNLNPASGRISGQYYEINEQTNELFYFGDWTAAR